MKNGERTPRAVRTQIIKMAGSIPRPTNKAIKAHVEHRFDIKISDRTIYRICEKAGLATRSKPADITHSWAAQMEQSGHWPNLRRMAQDLAAQLPVALPKLLGFPWFYPKNENLLLFPGEKGIVAGHTMEADALFLALWEHLPKHKALALLGDWKCTTSNIASGLSDLCSWVEEQPEVSGWRCLSEEEIDRGDVGLTHYFSKSLALDSAEGVCFPHQNSSSWDISEANSRRDTYVLNWVGNGNIFVLVAASQEKEELEDVKALHQELASRMRSLELTQPIGQEWLKLERVIVELKKELERIAILALFPGRCNLCIGASRVK